MHQHHLCFAGVHGINEVTLCFYHKLEGFSHFLVEDSATFFDVFMKDGHFLGIYGQICYKKFCSTINQSLINEMINVTDEDALSWSRLLAREEGLFEAISSGANVDAAVQLTKRMNKGQTGVTVLPDSQDLYASLGYKQKS